MEALRKQVAAVMDARNGDNIGALVPPTSQRLEVGHAAERILAARGWVAQSP
jgi:predicted ATPase